MSRPTMSPCYPAWVHNTRVVAVGNPPVVGWVCMSCQETSVPPPDRVSSQCPCCGYTGGAFKYDSRCVCPLWSYDSSCPVGNDHGNHPRSSIESGEATIVPTFRGKYAFLSNFYPIVDRQRVAPDISVAYDGVLHPTSEHAFAAAKTLDLNQRAWVGVAASPGAAKHRGQQVTLRPNWESVRVHIMWMVCMDKFCRNAELRKGLLATGTAELVEGNTWGDRYWGRVDGIGQNWLGIVLMSVRGYLAWQKYGCLGLTRIAPQSKKEMTTES